jgi:hypothetical protein
MSSTWDDSRRARVSAPEAFSAKFSARRASAAPKAEAVRAYKLMAPMDRPSAVSGSARQDRIPWAAARSSNSGHRALTPVSFMRLVSSMRTVWPSRMACRQGPSSSLYWTSSTCAATGSLHATVIGRPPDRTVMPQESPPRTRPAASLVISRRNCSTLSVLSNASCSSLKSPLASSSISLSIGTPSADAS